MKIFSKITSNEYNNRLEKILENKPFDEDAKNLLLSMLYKIENGYKDYIKVKYNAISKDQFMEKLLNIIAEECYELNVVTPQTDESKPLENEKTVCIVDVYNGSILVYANEEDILYSLIKMDLMYGRLKKNKKKEKEEWYLKKAIQEFFIQGNCINYCETIRDFDGWSWNNSIKSIHDMEINLVFQNIMMLGLKSEDFENASYVHLNSGNELYRLFYIIILTLIAEKNENMKMQIINRKKETSEMLDLMKEKVAFLNKITEEKKSIFDEIRRIDEILNDKEKLRTEYYKRNSKLANKNKIFSVSFLADIMENEREEKMKELKELNEFLDPRNYAVKKQIIENENYVLETVVEDLKNSENKHTTIISLQENFLYEFSKKIEKNIENKESLRSLIYEFRYYCLIPISKKENISDVSEISESIQKVMNTIIDNSIDKELITNFSNSTSLCYTILKHIFETKIIDLEEIKIKINNIKEEKYLNEVKNKIAISIYDSKETESIYEETVLNLKQLNVRINKKIPLFL